MEFMRHALAVILVVATLAAPAAATAAAPATELGRARAEQARAAREYRASLERAAHFQSDAVERAARTAQSRRELFATGLISRLELETSERDLAAAEAALAETRRHMAESEALIAEAEAAVELASLPPVRPGEERAGATLVRFHGLAAWTLGLLPAIERFFSARFGRPLPVSAFGQTPLHDRLGFDHRNAVDVAVHPDSAEGAGLMAWLRERGISFIAFRGAVPGAATGAHVHVGEPSPRRSARAPDR